MPPPVLEVLVPPPNRLPVAGLFWLPKRLPPVLAGAPNGLLCCCCWLFCPNKEPPVLVFVLPPNKLPPVLVLLPKPLFVLFVVDPKPPNAGLACWLLFPNKLPLVLV